MTWGISLLNAGVDAATAEMTLVVGVDGELTSELTSRETVTWGAAVDGVATATNQPVLEVADPCTLAYIVVCPSSGPGNVLAGMNAVDDNILNIVFTEAGTYTLTSMTLSVANPA